MDVRTYEVEARSTDVFGRVLTRARANHFVVDGPEQNGCPGEAVTPPELFLGGVATCGVELLQVLAKANGFPIPSVEATISGVLDRDHPVRDDLTLFNEVHVRFAIAGVDEAQAEVLVEGFKGR